MADPLSVSSNILSKMDKDEIYTFIHGFCVGLVFFLLLFVRFTQQGIELIIPSVFLASLILILFGLICTLFTYLLSIGCTLFYLKNSKKHIHDPSAGLQHIDVSRYNKNIVINIGDIANRFSSNNHLFSLNFSALVLLAYAPLVYVVIYRKDSEQLIYTLISIFLLCLAFVFLTLVHKINIDYVKVSYMIDQHKVQVTNDPSIVIKKYNETVDQIANGQIKSS
jgi:hypothetical protein